MIKRIMSLTMAILISFLILPVRSYAAAAGAGILIGGTVYAAGTYTFSTLPPVVQGIMNSAAEDYQSQLFPSRSSIILLDPKSQVGGGGNNNKKPTEPGQFEKFVGFLISAGLYVIEKIDENSAYSLSYKGSQNILDQEYLEYKQKMSEAEFELAEDIIQKSVDRVNEMEFGNTPLSCGRFIELEKDNVFRMLDEAGLMDEGKPYNV